MICNECHCTIQDDYRGACVTCLRRENARLRASVEKLRAVLEAAKNALPHINDVTNAAYDAEQRLQRAIQSAEAGSGGTPGQCQPPSQ